LRLVLRLLECVPSDGVVLLPLVVSFLSLLVLVGSEGLGLECSIALQLQGVGFSGVFVDVVDIALVASNLMEELSVADLVLAPHVSFFINLSLLFLHNELVSF
jgi:hypothetical protein